MSDLKWQKGSTVCTSVFGEFKMGLKILWYQTISCMVGNKLEECLVLNKYRTCLVQNYLLFPILIWLQGYLFIL